MMTSMWKVVWPVIVLAALALASARFIENPPYPVSQVHASLLFVLALFSLFYTHFSALRQSYGSFACGAAFGFLTIGTALLPDLWLRWPGLTLFGLGISQIASILIHNTIRKSLRTMLLIVLLISFLSAIPLAAIPYVGQVPGTRSAAAVSGAVMVLAGAVTGWKRRQRTSLIGAFSWLMMALVMGGLFALAFSNLETNIEARQQIEQYLLFALLFLGAVFIAELLKVEQQLRSGPHMELEASFRDPLTNLANRRALDTYGPRLITRSHEAGRAVSVIVADIDHFKLINDTHGHLAGDEVLRKTATRLAASVRKSDMVVRYGGEEFVIILPGSALAPAMRLAEQMRTALQEETVQYKNLTISRTASFGVATTFPEEPASLSELIHRADINLYRAKHDGRNCVMADALPPDDF